MSASQLRAWAEDEATRLMNKFDKNGDGVLNKEELKLLVQTTQNQGLISRTPKCNTNFVQKFGCSYHQKGSKKELSREQIKEIFKYHDADKDGFLNLKELTKAFAFMGSIVPFFKAQYALAYADDNKDGLISEAELHKLIDYAIKIVNKK